MGYNVQQRAECLGTFRWVAVRLMRLLAEWIPTTPEMEVKVLFGRHVWDCAQHADALGKRAFELRAPLHYTRQPAPEFCALLQEIADLAPTAQRVTFFYDLMLPRLAARFREYIE